MDPKVVKKVTASNVEEFIQSPQLDMRELEVYR